MADRQLVHVTKVAEFMTFLFHKHNAAIASPAEGEVFRVNIKGMEIGFSRRKGSDHLTTWGIGSRLARDYVRYTKELTKQ